MNKAELVTALAAHSSLSKVDAARAIDSMVDVITHTVASGDDVEIRGLGKFQQAERKARVGRVPGTGESVQIPARTVPTFKPSKGFKELVQA